MRIECVAALAPHLSKEELAEVQLEARAFYAGSFAKLQWESEKYDKNHDLADSMLADARERLASEHNLLAKEANRTLAVRQAYENGKKSLASVKSAELILMKYRARVIRLTSLVEQCKVRSLSLSLSLSLSSKFT